MKPDWKPYYGMTIVNPQMSVRIEIEPMKWWQHLCFWHSSLWLEVIVPAFLVACSITAFRVAFGLL